MKSEESGRLNSSIIRTVIPVILTILLFITVFYLFGIPSFRQNMLQSKKAMIKELTNTAIQLVSDYDRRALDGEISESEAKERAKERIQKLRYGPENKDYFWINDFEPVMIMHPYRSDLNGKNIADFTDPNGKHLFVEFVKTVSGSGSGYVDYMWQWKDDSTKIVPKLSFVEAYKPWDWIIGTGIYIEDVNEEIGRLTDKMMLVFTAFLFLLFALLGYLIWHGKYMAHDSNLLRSKILESENYYRKIFNTLNEAVIVFDYHTGVVLDINERVENIFGYSKKEIDDLNIIRNDETNSFSVIKNAFEQGKVLFEILLSKKNNDKFWGEINLRISKIAGKRCIIAVFRDITPRKKAEISMQKHFTFKKIITELSNRFINMPIDDIAEGIDKALASIGDFITVDRIYIYKFSENVQKMMNVNEWFKEGLTSRKIEQEEININRKDWCIEKLLRSEIVEVTDVAGSKKFVTNEKLTGGESIASFLAIPLGIKNEVIGFLGIETLKHLKTFKPDEIDLLKLIGEMITNTFNREQTEKYLRNNENRFRGIFENSNFGIFQTTLDGKLLLANKAFLSILGYSSLEEILMSNVKEKFYQSVKDREEFKKELLTKGDIQGYVNTIVTKVGKVKKVRESARLIEDKFGNKIIEGAIEDIS